MGKALRELAQIDSALSAKQEQALRVFASVFFSVALHLWLLVGVTAGEPPGVGPARPQALTVALAAAGPIPSASIAAAPPAPVARPPAAATRPPAPALPVPVPVYYPARELDQRPRVLEEPQLDPATLPQREATGRLVMSLYISEAGRVDRVELESSELPAAYGATVGAIFSGTRFTPGMRSGRPVKSVMRIEVNYDRPA